MVSSLRHCIRRLYATSGVAFAAKPRNFLALATSTDHLRDESHDDSQANMLFINSKLRELGKMGQLSDARKMFDELPQRDEISWTNMIAGYVNVSDMSEALSLFSRMWVEPNLQMDPFALSLALKACGLSMNEKYGESLHGNSMKTGLVNSVFVGTALVDMYTKIGRVLDGCRVFDEMPFRNVVSWTTIITGLVHAGYDNEGLMSFAEMWRESITYDSYTLAIALKACANLGKLNYGKEIHTHAIKKGLDASSYVANSLATMYNKCNKLNYGLQLFIMMSTKDVVSWTTLITTYVQMGEEHLGIQTFLRMRESAVSPNGFTFSAIISGCANLLKLDWGKQLHAHVFHLGLSDYLSVANSLITIYSKCGRLDSASKVFYEMSTRDIVSWSTIIAGYAQGGCGEEAFEFLSSMRRIGPKPTEFALASILSLCGSMAILDQGKQLHAHVLTIGLDHTAMIRSALINMYSKCGGIGEASNIFYMAENDDIISWTAMINGYADHGYSYEAINLFEGIPKVGLRPDSVTFIGVLSACSHVGLVDLGFHYFNLMSKVYKINPSKEHYGCMIDLLCRAGRLHDAENLIKSMPPLERDDVVWSTLLRASRLNGDVECGKHAAEQILNLDPSCAATHITLASIYASRGKWREAAQVRKLMKSKGVVKDPGWSLG
ncbi:hypothetical protein ACH5RR_011786 [Cinchona calisaya]|uniref:Pentatricopeptide repeat-containing protein n=1 Tax=Cinchona calisaya TaxID=153742 RepID=A0ABD3A9I6_9GENT